MLTGDAVDTALNLSVFVFIAFAAWLAMRP